MAGALRKLLTEIDKTMKKIDEGIATFEAIWEKVRANGRQGATRRQKRG